MKLPGINDIASQADKFAKNAAQNLEKALNDVANQVQAAPGKIDKAIQNGIANLYQGIDLASDAAARNIRAQGELFASGVQVLGEAETKIGNAGLDVLETFAGVYGDILKDRMDQAGRLGEILIGKNPLLQKLDIFDLLAAKKCGTLEQLPTNPLKGLLDRLRDLIEGGKVFGEVPPPVVANPLPFPFPKPFPLPKPFPGIPPFVPTIPGGALQGMVEQIRDLLATLVEAIKQRGTQQPGTTSPLPDISNPPAIPGTNGSGDFKDAIFGQVRTIDGKISELRGEIASGKLTPEQAQEKMIELQEQMQLKMQLIQMLTNLMKTEHDMAMAVIRNLAV